MLKTATQPTGAAYHTSNRSSGAELSGITARAACEPQAHGAVLLREARSGEAAANAERTHVHTERKPVAVFCRWRSVRTTALARRGACAFGLLQAA